MSELDDLIAQADGVMVRGRHVERIYQGSELVRDSVTNLFTNQLLEGSGAWVEVGRNLFTNPRLVGDGTWAEVRRNYLTAPKISDSFSNSSRWFVSSSATAVAVTNGIEVTVNTAINSGSSAVASPNTAAGGYVPVSAGDKVSAVAKVTNTGTVAVTLFTGVQWYAGSSGAGTAYSPSTLIAPGETVELRLDGATAPEIATTGVFVVRGPGIPAGSKFILHNYPAIEKAPISGPMFNPSAPFGAADPDMRSRWLGTENASMSVMEGEAVPRVGAIRAIAIKSTKDGKPAVRVIATDPSNFDTFAFVNLPTGAVRTLGTMVATLHLDQPMAPADSRARRLVAYSPQFNGSQAPNEAGAHRISATFGPLTSSYTVRLYHGGRLGDRDVWWTDIAIFAGDYRYPWLGGEDLSTLDQPEDFRTRWTGAVDNSEMVLEGESVAGLRANECVGIVSTASGKPAVRVIPTTTSNNTYVEIDPRYVVTEAASYTALGTLTTKERPLLGQSNTRVLRTISPDGRTPVPSWDPGSYPMRREFEWIVNSGSGRLLFFNGDAHGGPDVWWSDIALVAGDYDGPPFTGDTHGAWWLPDGTSRRLAPTT